MPLDFGIIWWLIAISLLHTGRGALEKFEQSHSLTLGGYKGRFYYKLPDFFSRFTRGSGVYAVFLSENITDIVGFS